MSRSVNKMLHLLPLGILHSGSWESHQHLDLPCAHPISHCCVILLSVLFSASQAPVVRFNATGAAKKQEVYSSSPLPWAARVLWDERKGSLQKHGECITCLQNPGAEPKQPSQPSAVLSGSNTCGRLNLSTRLSHNPYRLLFLSMQILKPIFHLLWFKLSRSLSLSSLFTPELPFLPLMSISLLLSPQALPPCCLVLDSTLEVTPWKPPRWFSGRLIPPHHCPSWPRIFCLICNRRADHFRLSPYNFSDNPHIQQLLKDLPSCICVCSEGKNNRSLTLSGKGHEALGIWHAGHWTLPVNCQHW